MYPTSAGRVGRAYPTAPDNLPDARRPDNPTNYPTTHPTDKRYHKKTKMFDWIGNLFNKPDPELDELDRRIAAADARWGREASLQERN